VLWTEGKRICIAAQEEQLDTVQRLLSSGTSASARDAAGYTALHYAARNGHVGIVELLLAARANVNAAECSFTPLLRAAFMGHTAIVSMLLSRKADVSTPDTVEGLTPLHKAAARGHGDVVGLLLAAGGESRAAKSGKRPEELTTDIGVLAQLAGVRPLALPRERASAEILLRVAERLIGEDSLEAAESCLREACSVLGEVSRQEGVRGSQYLERQRAVALNDLAVVLRDLATRRSGGSCLERVEEALARNLEAVAMHRAVLADASREEEASVVELAASGTGGSGGSSSHHLSQLRSAVEALLQGRGNLSRSLYTRGTLLELSHPGDRGALLEAFQESLELAKAVLGDTHPDVQRDEGELEARRRAAPSPS